MDNIEVFYISLSRSCKQLLYFLTIPMVGEFLVDAITLVHLLPFSVAFLVQFMLQIIPFPSFSIRYVFICWSSINLSICESTNSVVAFVPIFLFGFVYLLPSRHFFGSDAIFFDFLSLHDAIFFSDAAFASLHFALPGRWPVRWPSKTSTGWLNRS